MNIGKIFFILKEQEKISKEELYECGANDKYIEGAVSNDVLRETDDSYYVAGDTEALVEYGRVLIERRNYKAATSVFLCAYVNDFDNYDVNLQLLYNAATNTKPKKSHIFKHFDVVYEKLVENGKEYDANYYLLLIGNLFGCYNKYNDELAGVFEKYNEKFNALEEKDILKPEEDGRSKVENKLRECIYANLYHEVDKLFRVLFIENPIDDDFEFAFERDLVLVWIEAKKYINRKLSEYLNHDEIEEAKKLLDREDLRRSLTKTNEYILRLVNSYLTIKDTGVIPVSKYEGDNAFDAIMGNNYKLALELETNRIKEKGIKKETYLRLMLRKIVGLIEPDKKEEVVVEEVKEEEIKLTYSEKQSLEAKIKTLRSGRILYLLEPMPQEKRDAVREYIKTKGYDKDIRPISVGEEPERRIALRYKPIIEEQYNVRDLLDKAKECDAAGEYEESIANYELILKIGQPKAFTYSRYGRALLHVGRSKEAVDCFKLATILSKTNGDGKYDFTNLIESIECPSTRENRKPKAEVKESEFERKKETVLSEEIIRTLVDLCSDGKTKLVDACKQLNMSEEDTNCAKLIYARDCYYTGNDYVGDLYLKQVEKSKAKDDRVKGLYNDIKRDKKYYRNRLDSEKSQLVLIKK